MSEATPFDLDTLIDEAKTQTGLTDFGDWQFQEPLQRLLQALDTEAQLNAVGRATQRQRLLDILCTRLRFQGWVKRHPEILEEQIERPVVIVGLPRTGTTLLQRMLAADPRFYSAAWWETRFPVPEGEINFANPVDPRIALAKAEVQAMLEHVPELAAIHPLDAEAADEEITLLEQSFYSTNPEALANVASFGEWLVQQDQTEGYAYLKQLLQFLQWQKKQRDLKADRWVLKSPHHIHCMDTLFKVFPDAQVIQTHRDPLQTIPSLASFIYNLWRLGSDQADPQTVGAQWNAKMASGLHHCMQVRRDLPTGRFLDVDFRDTVARPMAVLEAVYDFLGLELTASAREVIERWRQNNRREQRAPHTYSLAQFGLSETQLQQDYADYRQAHITAQEH